MRRMLTGLWLLLLGSGCLQAQLPDIRIANGRNYVEIPFEYENNFLVVELLFNDFIPLRFVFDTGAEHTMLTQREVTDMLRIDYQKRFTIYGADLTTELYAYLVRNIRLEIGQLIASNRSILVLDEDYFRFREFAGINVHGIIGADLFRRYVVTIDYRRQVIILEDPETFTPPADYIYMPLEVHRSKPYIHTRTRMATDTIIDTKLLLDTGGSLSLLLYADTDPRLTLPERVIPTNIGLGLGGYMRGYLGRISQMDVQHVTFREIVTNFHTVNPKIDSSFMNNRNGIIGNKLLERFRLVLDYPRERLYLSPDKRWTNEYDYDKSGLVLVASGPHLNEFTVYYVIEGSPADEAGLQAGDELRRINGWPVFLFDLEAINRKFRKRSGKRFKLVVRRGKENKKFVFRLRELI